MVNDMRGTVKLAIAVMTALMLSMVPFSASATTFYGNETELWCYKTDTAPTIDGVMSTGEWSDADRIYWYYTPETNHKDANIYIYSKWDDTAIYFCVDLCPDNTTENGDYCYLLLDEDHDGNFAMDSDWEHMVYTLGSSPTYGVMVAMNRTDAEGDGQVPTYMGFDSSPNVAWDHRIIEFQVNLTAINYSTTMGMIITGYGTLAPNYFSTEGANASNYDLNDTVANWTDLKLSNQYYIAGQITNEILPQIIALMGVVVTLAAVMVVFRSLGRSMKGTMR
jgi:hypothetical protein